ncbi:hypothetical protein JW698_01440 [Candidatus Wolfebacteria bacterium]|nr:hypothetical protein [Candidatus Wolfebacteria bacterium]
MLNQIKEWLTEYKRDIVIFILIFLISSLSFGLGYLVNREFHHAPIVIEKCGGVDEVN